MHDARRGSLRASAFHVAAVLAILASLALAAPAGAAAPRIYRQRRYLRALSGDSISLAFRKQNLFGDLIVVYVVWDSAGSVSLSDSLGNQYQSAVGPTALPGGGPDTQVFYARNVAAGPNTVTASFASPIAARAVLYIHEYAGMDRLAPLDAAVAATGTSGAMDSGPLATTASNDLLFLAAASNGRAIRRGRTGFRVRSRSYGNMTADAIGGAPGWADATAVQLGTAWAVQFVAFKPAGSTPPPPSTLLKVGPTGRYLVDQNGTPFLITGDSPQAMSVNLSEAEMESFLADRQAAGFNTVWVNLLCATYTGGRPDGSTYDGILPFTHAGDLSTPNEAFFARVDDLLRIAAQHGIVVLLDPAETGSFLSVLNDNGAAKARDYGRYLGTRYRNFDNIVWMSGNDFQSWRTPSDDAVVRAVALGIRDTDDRHIHTIELDYLVSGSLDDASWAPIISLNASYTYYPTYAQVLTDYNRPNAIPTFLVEANYEFEHNAADQGTPEILRRQAYWALLSGAAGQLYGNHYTWPFSDGWQANLDTPGSQDMGYVKFLFAPRQWFNLIPDQDHSVVTSGYGTFTSTGALSDSDYLTAARTPDGSLAMAYMPTVRTIGVDLSKLGAPVYASWYDPSAGSFAAIAGSPFANAGTHSFTPPAQNAAGDGDWVLVLEATGVPPDAIPPSKPTGLATTTVTSSEVAFTWSPSTDNVAVAGYQVFRDGVLLRTTPSTSFDDTGLSAATAYDYTVAAYDYANNVSAVSSPLHVTTASPGPEFVQAGYATPQSSQSQVAAAYADAQSAGNTNIVAIGWNDTAASIVSVTDGAHNAYQQAVATARGSGLSQAIWFASGIAAAPAGNQVTVTFDRPAAFVDLRIAEYSGLRASNPFDAGASAAGNGSLASSGNLTTSAASDLLFAAGMTGGSFSGAGTGFTSRVITAPDGDLVEDALAGSPGSYGSTAPLGSGTWLLQLAAFRAAP